MPASISATRTRPTAASGRSRTSTRTDSRSPPAATRSNATFSASAFSASRSRSRSEVMAQPKDFGFGSEEQMVRDSARKLLKDAAGIETLRALVARDHKSAYESAVQPAPWDERKAAFFVVAAASEGGVGLYAVAADTPGVTIQPDRIADLTRDQARLELDDARLDGAAIVAAPGAAAAVIAAATPAILTIVAADLCGAAEWQLQTTAEYARVRT